MKRVLIKTIVLTALFLFAMGDAMAQLRMKSVTQSGSPSKFMKAHPEYIYLNKPDRDNVTGFDYYISETLNPGGAGLNSSNYYIIIESFDYNEKPKALIWDGVLKQKLVKKMTTASKKVVYFNNIFILDEKNLLTFQGYDEKYKLILKCGLSGNGSSYAKNWWQKHTITGDFTVFARAKVKTEWTENPAQWLKDKLSSDNTHRNFSLQDPATLKGTYGWFFDIVNTVSKETDDKYNYFYDPKIYFWKDKDHTIPLNICKMAGTELSYHPEMNRDEASFDNVVNLSKSFNPGVHQYYFFDWTSFADAGDAEMLPNGKARLKAYYTVDINAQMGKRRKGHVLLSLDEEGVITIDVDVVSDRHSQRFSLNNEQSDNSLYNNDLDGNKNPSGNNGLNNNKNPNTKDPNSKDPNSQKDPNNQRNPNNRKDPNNNGDQNKKKNNENNDPSNNGNNNEKPQDPRLLCPPHKYEVVGSADSYSVNNSSFVSKPKSSLPQIVTLTLGEKQLELLRQDLSDGSVYYISKKPADSYLWEYAMKGDSELELFGDFYNEDKSYNRVMDFLEKLNEKARKRNLPYSFMLPTFEELKNYASNNNDFYSFYPSFVDSIKICSNTGSPLTLEQYLALNNKTGVFFLGGTLKDKSTFEGVSLNDSTHRIQFYLKAIPDNQQKETKKTSVTRLGLLKKIVKRCSKCGKEVYTYKHSKAKTVQQMIESVNDEEDEEETDIYSFCEKLYKMREESLVNNTLLKKKWRFCYGSGKEKTYESADKKYRLETKKKKKKDSSLESVELMFDCPETNDVFEAIAKLGYKCVKKNLNVPSTYGESRNYRFDWYQYSNDEGYSINLSVFTYNRDKVSYYVTFVKY